MIKKYKNYVDELDKIHQRETEVIKKFFNEFISDV
jgi:hypothetical protein